jgi:hypothetical protein
MKSSLKDCLGNTINEGDLVIGKERWEAVGLYRLEKQKTRTWRFVLISGSEPDLAQVVANLDTKIKVNVDSSALTASKISDQSIFDFTSIELNMKN